MKKGILILAVLALAASAWATGPRVHIGGVAEVAGLEPSGGSTFIPTDTLKYHTIMTDLTGYYWPSGNDTVYYQATRFTPSYTGTIDSMLYFIYAPHSFSAAITESIFFWRDTTITQRQPGTLTTVYTISIRPTSQNLWIYKVRYGTSPFAITNGVDFWSGTLGLQRAPNSGDSLRLTTDTSTTTVNDRQFFGWMGRGETDWYQCDAAGIDFDWGISFFANQGSGVELLTPGGAVSLPPRLYPASPNPFRGTGEIAFDLPKASRVELAIHDLAGRLVRSLASGETNAGHHAVRWDGKDALGRPVASGVYLYTLRAGALYATRSLVVVR